MAGTVQEKALAAEWLVVVLVEAGDAFNRTSTYTAPTGARRLKMPPPSRFIATMVVYMMLAAAALFGEAPGKVAAGLGGLVALTLVLVPPNPKALPGKGNEPAIVSFFQWLDKMMKDPPKSPPSITTHWATRPAPTRSTPGTYTPQTGKSTPKRAPGYPVGQGGQR